MTPRERLVLDLTIFVVVVSAANPLLTGISLHEWLGFVLVVPTLVHLIVNWDWVLRIVSRLFGRIANASRINLVVDAGLFGSLIAVTLSGVLVIPGLAASLGLSASGQWHAVHLAASNLTVALSLAHLALHWRWVTGVARRWGAAALPPIEAPRLAVISADPARANPVREYPAADSHTALAPGYRR